MSDPFVGEIRMAGFNFAPRGWATCDGQLLPISQNTALFSLLGTMYGGNGTSTFALPDLRTRMPIGQGSGPGLTPTSPGDRGGEATHTLTASEMPSHRHGMNASASGTSTTAGPLVALANPGGTTKVFRAATNLVATASPLSPSGGGQAHENRQPYLAVNFVIALQGVFPSRN